MVAISLWPTVGEKKPLVMWTTDGFALVLSKIESAVALQSGFAMFSISNPNPGVFYLSAKILTECVVVVTEASPEEVQQ